jgi:hypothetical protein
MGVLDGKYKMIHDNMNIIYRNENYWNMFIKGKVAQVTFQVHDTFMKKNHI